MAVPALVNPVPPAPTSVGHLYKSDTRGFVCQCNNWVGNVGKNAVMCTEGKQNTPLWIVLRVLVDEASPPLPPISHLLWVVHSPCTPSGTRPRMFLFCSCSKMKAKFRSCYPVGLVGLWMPCPTLLNMLSLLLFIQCFWFG